MSKLQEYMYDQYGIAMLGSEIDDILALARQEIELPDEDEILNAASDLYDVGGTEWTKDTPVIWRDGVEWALGKVRNPYPKLL